MTDKNNDDYPLMEKKGSSLRSGNGRPMNEITMANVESGELTAEDIRIDAQTLLEQAQIAQQAGLPQLAANLNRAAELTAVPNETLLDMYEMLRPERSSFDELQALAAMLEEQFNALDNALFVREAAAVYKARGLLRREK